MSTEEPRVMSESPPVSTWELLRTLGFAEKGRKLHFKVDNLELEASQVWNEWLAPVVFLHGLYRGPRATGMIADDLPPEVESREQGLAYLAYYLDGSLPHPIAEPAWLKEGRSYQYLLPWNRRLAGFNARPQCSVQREWVRLAFKRLAAHLAKLDDDVPVIFGFGSGVLTIRCAGNLIAMPADGRSWTHCYSVKAAAFRKLPKRMMHDPVGFSVWDSALTIGNRRFSGATAVDAGEDASDSLRAHDQLTREMMAERLANRLADLLQKQDPEERKEAISKISHLVWESHQIMASNGTPQRFARSLFLDNPVLAKLALEFKVDPEQVDDPVDLVARLLPSDEHMM
jgi:hypothetical protein